jgi:hypothetical protein
MMLFFLNVILRWIATCYITMAQELQTTYPEAKWFWSHPKDGHKSTMVPALIMQNKKNLANARKTFKLLRNGKNLA